MKQRLLVALVAATTACTYEPVAPPKTLTRPAARSPFASLAPITVRAGLETTPPPNFCSPAGPSLA